jgi:D-alanyl-D-alanine carboxypeptidase (penicillin-binding protein 5/6)
MARFARNILLSASVAILALPALLSGSDAGKERLRRNIQHPTSNIQHPIAPERTGTEGSKSTRFAEVFGDSDTFTTGSLAQRLCATKRRRPASTPAAVTPARPPELQPGPNGALPLAAWGAICIDALTGKVLYESNADAPQYPASTTKIMTALLVVEEGDLDHEVECDLEDSKVGESSLNLKPGERFTRRQMLYGLMLKSANDVAHALGRDNAGSIEAFAEKMTRRAKELGATNTHFANPNGLHNPDHYTTPRDLACIARAAMQQPFFRQVVGTRDYTWMVNGVPDPLHNHNRLLERFPGCTGVKTGYTIPAQQVLVSSAMRGNHEVISVVMHTDKPGIWNDSMLLLSYGLDQLAKDAVAAVGSGAARTDVVPRQDEGRGGGETSNTQHPTSNTQ